MVNRRISTLFFALLAMLLMTSCQSFVNLLTEAEIIEKTPPSNFEKAEVADKPEDKLSVVNDSLMAAVNGTPDPALKELIEEPAKQSDMEKDKPEEPKGPYRLKIGDSVEISVLDEPDMTREVKVIPDGTITYLLVGEVPAENRTIKELRESISESLKKYYVNPIVSVLTRELAEEEIAEEEKEHVSLVGALNKPGKYELKKGDRLIDSLAAAGGLLFINDIWGGRTVANLKASYISRNGKRLDVDFDQLLRVGDMNNNIEMKDGDFIYIADSETTTIYVMGEVQSPQAIPFNKDLTLIDALARSGGFTTEAQRSKVIVLRGSDKAKKSIKVDVEGLLLGEEGVENVSLKSGDIIFVPEQGLSEYSRYVKYLSDFANIILQGYQVREAVMWPRLNRYTRR